MTYVPLNVKHKMGVLGQSILYGRIQCLFCCQVLHDYVIIRESTNQKAPFSFVYYQQGRIPGRPGLGRACQTIPGYLWIDLLVFEVLVARYSSKDASTGGFSFARAPPHSFPLLSTIGPLHSAIKAMGRQKGLCCLMQRKESL